MLILSVYKYLWAILSDIYLEWGSKRQIILTGYGT
jgi:hypothetical protein